MNDEIKNWCDKDRNNRCKDCGTIAVNLVEGKCRICRKKQ